MVKNGWIVPATAGDNRFYGDKTAALAWVGNWMWRAHKTGLGNDLVLIPAPKLAGNPFLRTVVGAGLFQLKLKIRRKWLNS